MFMEPLPYCRHINFLGIVYVIWHKCGHLNDSLCKNAIYIGVI